MADQAFKTPTLRELVWTAPYTHDGSIGTLDDLIRMNEMGGVERPTRSRDLPQNLRLTDEERDDLIAFLESLSSETPPKPSTEAWMGSTEPPRPRPAADTTVVSQLDKLFNPSRVRLKAGQTLSVLNDDTRTHNVRIDSATFDTIPAPRSPSRPSAFGSPTRHLRSLLRDLSHHAPHHRGAVTGRAVQAHRHPARRKASVTSLPALPPA